MNLIKHKSRSPFSLDPFSDLDSWTDQFFNLMRSADSHFHLPATDISETDNAYEVSAELPGMRKEDIKVSLDGGVLTIEAETQSEEEQKEGKRVLRRERRSGHQLRRFALGPNVNEEEVSARFENGVLHLTIPKQAPHTPEKRTIAIN